MVCGYYLDDLGCARQKGDHVPDGNGRHFVGRLSDAGPVSAAACHPQLRVCEVLLRERLYRGHTVTNRAMPAVKLLVYVLFWPSEITRAKNYDELERIFNSTKRISK